MSKLVVIGTLHANLTPEDELLGIIESYTPQQILVEISQTDLGAGNTASYPPEMIAVYRWAQLRGIDVQGFDAIDLS